MVRNLLLLLYCDVHVLALSMCIFQLWLLMLLLLFFLFILIWRFCCYAINAFECNAQRNYPHPSFWATAVNLFSLQLSKDRWWWYGNIDCDTRMEYFFNLWWCMSSVCAVRWIHCTLKLKLIFRMEKGVAICMKNVQ